MEEWKEALNAYEVLGLENGPKATDAEISKAYRQLALKYHPDKQKGAAGKEEAARLFQRAKDAKDLLADEGARAALNALLRARAAQEAKFAGQDAKRRRMREKLERDEKCTTSARSEEQTARDRLQGELTRLRREAAAKKAAAAAAARPTPAATAGGAGLNAAAAGEYATPLAGGVSGSGWAPTAAAPPVITEELLRTLKVSWSAKEGTYTSQQIRDACAVHGPVADVVLREAKKKSRRSAIVMMATRAGAAACAQAVVGEPSRPLLVTPVLRIPAVPGESSTPSTTATGPPPEGVRPSTAAGGSAPTDSVIPAPSAAAASAALHPSGPAAAAAAAGTTGDPPRSSTPSLFPIDLDAAGNTTAAAQQSAPLFPIGDGVAPINPSASSAAQQQQQQQFDDAAKGSAATVPAGSHVPAAASSFPLGGATSFPGGASSFPSFSYRPPEPHASAATVSAGIESAGATSSGTLPAAPGPKATSAADVAGAVGKFPGAFQGLAGRQGAPVAPTAQLSAAKGVANDAARAAERARLIAQMEAEDRAEELAAH
mmetsp:Transcript_14172/g.42763  ORF Transcript_14172/g.42763 Transcript_14172/m.42763 type:complete len:545 (-) Transcript_14172:382-2016(-)|eukprot:CAMPEP_0206143252 /NCGR_PEP_ID=MMETSP1473-20131121/19865_1 /ASSEMBLY_ACC=CAM_ASM_001109 /TAXON_ID=1461547 /ORGANISM="Stichococcus sp, Strain RCC1054" /LENGTH=544 /DNA_ID=CAMNT_0053538577 /DNA_START=603 /DNA_END=2237 /DNA_ORIENTATION=-